VQHALRAAGFSPTCRPCPNTDARDGVQIEVPLFGRRGDLGIDAIAATRSVVRAMRLPEDCDYFLQGHGGTRESRLWGRLNADAWERPEDRAKAEKLKDLE
jgi:hypothetical protein